MHPQAFHQLAWLDLAEREGDRRRRPTSRRALRREAGRGVTPPTPRRTGEGNGARRTRRAPVRPDGPAGGRP
jgi:hypothetical protein